MPFVLVVLFASVLFPLLIIPFVLFSVQVVHFLVVLLHSNLYSCR